jgi:putative FmdB family regulatory protein
MPIYAYKCESCGHRQDVLQKISDPALSVCPACGAASFAKQVTAAGFQLKGSGWYVTDFRGGSTAASGDKADGADKSGDKTDGKAADKHAEKSTDKAAKPAEGAAAPAAAPAPAPASKTGSSTSDAA